MSDVPVPSPEDPLSVYRDRPAGQQVKCFLAGHTSFGQELELSFTLTLPDNVEAREQGARRLAHSAWHLIAGQEEPETETYDIDGEVDTALVEATNAAIKEAVERQQRQDQALQEFMTKLYEQRPKGMTPKWN